MALTIRIINGDCREALKSLSNNSVDCCVCSPPYFNLRDYDVAGQIGQEQTPSEFVEALVDVFREVRRVLRDDGSLWLNIGDSYCNVDKWGGGGKNIGKNTVAADGTVPSWAVRRKREKIPGIKPKDLIGIPWMLAFALRDDGWYLRSGNIWGKPNGMPESTKDRPTVAHEFVFQLSKSDRYYYGYDDVRLPAVPESVARLERSMRGKIDGEDHGSLVISGGGYSPLGQPPHNGARKSDKQRGHTRRHAGFNDRWDAMEKSEQQSQGAALRSVWWIAPGGFDEAHFAVMPAELAAVCILAGCPKGGGSLRPLLWRRHNGASCRPSRSGLHRDRTQQGLCRDGRAPHPQGWRDAGRHLCRGGGMSVQPFLFGEGWIEVKDGDDTARAIFDNHYSRYFYKDGRKPKLFLGPGEKMVLLTRDADALCAWRKFISGDGQIGVNCAIFRREGGDTASSLLAQAREIAWRRWPDERLFTYVDPLNVPPTIRAGRPTWGHCFYQDGWKFAGLTKKRLHILERLP